MKKKKILNFILQSLITFVIWLIGTFLIFILNFEKPAPVALGWVIIVAVGVAVFRMVMSEKKDKK